MKCRSNNLKVQIKKNQIKIKINNNQNKRLGNPKSTKYVINLNNACSNSTPKSTIQLAISWLIGLDDIAMKIKAKKIESQYHRSSSSYHNNNSSKSSYKRSKIKALEHAM